MNLHYTGEIRDCLDLFSTPIILKSCLGQICNDSVQFQLEMLKISRRLSRSSDYAELLVISRCCLAVGASQAHQKTP